MKYPLERLFVDIWKLFLSSPLKNVINIKKFPISWSKNITWHDNNASKCTNKATTILSSKLYFYYPIRSNRKVIWITDTFTTQTHWRSRKILFISFVELFLVESSLSLSRWLVLLRRHTPTNCLPERSTSTCWVQSSSCNENVVVSWSHVLIRYLIFFYHAATGRLWILLLPTACSLLKFSLSVFFFLSCLPLSRSLARPNKHT